MGRELIRRVGAPRQGDDCGMNVKNFERDSLGKLDPADEGGPD